MIYSQIITSFSIIYDVLERIERAITFSKLNTFHNSIVEPDELLKEIQTVNEHVRGNRLPFEPTLENVLLFEKTLEIKSYSKGNQIVFVIQIPIVENENYNYYHSYSLPTPNGNMFRVILPHAKYLIMNDKNYVVFNEKCQELAEQHYICHEANPMKITKVTPCEVQLLKYLNATRCQGVQVHIRETKLEKLEQNKWIVIAPSPVVAIQKCGPNEDSIPLRGTTLLELDTQCAVEIGDVIIQTYQDSNTNLRSAELPNLDFELFNNHLLINNHTNLELRNVPLDELRNVNMLLDVQKHNINRINNLSFDNNINIWTIITYIIIFSLIISFACYYYVKRIRNKRRGQAEIELEGMELQGKPMEVTTNPRISL